MIKPGDVVVRKNHRKVWPWTDICEQRGHSMDDKMTVFTVDIEADSISVNWISGKRCYEPMFLNLSSFELTEKLTLKDYLDD